MGQLEKLVCSSLLVMMVVVGSGWCGVPPVVEERCRDDSYCKAYCFSTNPETVSARCGSDQASCICITPNNHAVKVRFIEERSPVLPTTPTTTTTQRPLYPGNTQYVTSQSIPKTPYNNYNNGNSIGNGLQSPAQQQQQQSSSSAAATPVLLECDASETSTRMCHLFCTMEIRAWYGLCNITSKACACFGIPLSAVQQEPIAAIFHSTAPSTPPTTTTTTPRPTYARPGGYQQYPLYQYPHNNQQQRPSPPLQGQPSKPPNNPWRPIIPSSYQPLVNYYQHPNAPGHLQQQPPPYSPTLLTPQQQQLLHEHTPVRSQSPNVFGQQQPQPPMLNSFSPPDTSTDISITTSVSEHTENAPLLESDTLKPAEDIETEVSPTTTTTPPPPPRQRRSINATPLLKGKDVSQKMEKVLNTAQQQSNNSNCSRYKCAISCKKSNYVTPNCQPKCIDDECWCECFPNA